MSKFPENLRRLLAERGIKQAKLSDHLGVSKATVSRYFLGQREPNLDNLVRIADFFGVTTDYLLGRTQIVKVKKKPPSEPSG